MVNQFEIQNSNLNETILVTHVHSKNQHFAIIEGKESNYKAKLKYDNSDELLRGLINLAIDKVYYEGKYNQLRRKG